EVVRGVGVAPAAELQRQRAAVVMAQLAADHLLHRAGAVGQAPGGIGVELVVAFAAQHPCVRAPAGDRAQAGAQRHRVLLVAVAVRVGRVHAAAGEHRRADAAARVDAVGALVAGVHAEPGARAAPVQAGAGFAEVVAARTQVRTGLQAFARAAGEHLDDAADGFAAVQARARATHDLDAFDQLQ